LYSHSLTIAKRKEDELTRLLETQLNGIEESNGFLGITNQELLFKKLYELQKAEGMSPTVLEKWQAANDSYLRVAEILELLQKNKNPIPDICCFHSPKLKRLLMKDGKFLHESLQDLNKDHTHKQHDSFMVLFSEYIK
jgi:hypothetical protein